MTFTDAVKVCFTKYADFSGCASRSEFWWWVLFALVVSIAFDQVSYDLSSAFSVATLLPGIAIGARRLRDTDRSGWWQLFYFRSCYRLDHSHHFLRLAGEAKSIW